MPDDEKKPETRRVYPYDDGSAPLADLMSGPVPMTPDEAVQGAADLGLAPLEQLAAQTQQGGSGGEGGPPQVQQQGQAQPQDLTALADKQPVKNAQTLADVNQKDAKTFGGSLDGTVERGVDKAKADYWDENAGNITQVALAALIGGIGAATGNLAFFPIANALAGHGSKGINAWYAKQAAEREADIEGALDPEKQAGLFINSATDAYAQWTGTWEAFRESQRPLHSAMTAGAIAMAPFDSVLPPGGPTSPMFEAEQKRRELVDKDASLAEVKKHSFEKLEAEVAELDKAGKLEGIKAQEARGVPVEEMDTSELRGIIAGHEPTAKTSSVSSAIFLGGTGMIGRLLRKRRGEEVAPFEDTVEGAAGGEDQLVQVGVSEEEATQYAFLEGFKGLKGPKSSVERDVKAGAAAALEWRDVPGSVGVQQLMLARNTVVGASPGTRAPGSSRRGHERQPGEPITKKEWIPIIKKAWRVEEATEKLREQLAEKFVAGDVELTPEGREALKKINLVWKN